MDKPTRAEKPAWSVPVRLEDIHESGRHFDLHADEVTRVRVAEAAHIPRISRLEASFDVTRRGADGLRVAGRVLANVTQTCVVTLEAVCTKIDEPIDVAFAPSAEPREPAFNEDHLEQPDGPEPLVNGMVDLGELTVEFLLLAMDPYPRKPGAVFQAPAREDASAHPFAVLAALRKGPGDAES